MIIIGESINSTLRGVGEAINRRDAAFLTDLAGRQVAAGAQVLDVNVGVAEGDETENLVWAVETVQSAVDVRLMLDSRHPEALRAAFQVHRGRPILNSISGEARHLATLLPVAAERDWEVILLCLDDNGIPKTAEARCAVATFLVEQATQAGLAPERLYVDPLIMALGSDWHAARVALDALALIRDAFPQVRTVAGVSNVSFGMPRRSLLNRTLLAMAMAYGLDALLINALDKALMASAVAANALLGHDEYCAAYLDAYHGGKLDG